MATTFHAKENGQTESRALEKQPTFRISESKAVKLSRIFYSTPLRHSEVSGSFVSLSQKQPILTRKMFTVLPRLVMFRETPPHRDVLQGMAQLMDKYWRCMQWRCRLETVPLWLEFFAPAWHGEIHGDDFVDRVLCVLPCGNGFFRDCKHQTYFKNAKNHERETNQMCFVKTNWRCLDEITSLRLGPLWI